jgi:hypothetical protein
MRGGKRRKKRKQKKHFLRSIETLGVSGKYTTILLVISSECVQKTKRLSRLKKGRNKLLEGELNKIPSFYPLCSITLQ